MTLILSTDKSRNKLTDLLTDNCTGVILSAFFSENAYNWISQFGLTALTVVVRGRPSDFLAGASSIEALRKLCLNGVEVRINQSLHAKLFWFGDQMLLGSSNLTGNGFNLLETGGNIELNSVIESTDDNVAVVERIVELSHVLDITKLTMMSEFLEVSAQEHEKHSLEWPKDIIKMAVPILSVNDFPGGNYDDCASLDTGPWGDISRFSNSGELLHARTLLESKNIYKWLFDVIESEGSVRFGKISSMLHDELSGDPSITRYDIKILQGNFYSFLKAIEADIAVTIPGKRSEVVQMR
jgi:hypothetical protein|tara:strand:- start:448 stop:1338 length:891 start_codon:yes stop_codon:yes gene_type:complete